MRPVGSNRGSVAMRELPPPAPANHPLLDPLTPTQRIILAQLDIPLPWPEQQT